MLDLFHNKKCCNCNNLFPCILWDFIALGFVVSWWRIKHAMKISTVLRQTHKKFTSKGYHENATWEVHARSWKVKCSAAFHGYLARWWIPCKFARKTISQDTRKTLYLEDFKCNFLSLHLCYIYLHYPQK